MEIEEFIRKALAIALDKQAENPRILEVSKNLSITDYFILLSVGNRRQAQAICAGIDIEMKHAGVAKARIEGYREGWWILLDFDSVVIHIFQAEARAYYDLDRLWADAMDETGLFLENLPNHPPESETMGGDLSGGV